jgi:hypothetical protein
MTMHAVRFKKLIEAVRSRPAKLFDMRVWKEKRECGTVGCAIGSFCIQHPHADLKLERGFSGFLRPGYKGNSDSYALSNYFDITIRQANALFWQNGVRRITKSDALKRLRKFYREHKGK